MSLNDSATCAAPCAGIIRFRFRRSAGPCPPSQPVGRAPVWPILARALIPPATLRFVTDRHEQLRSARLYLVCDDHPDEFLARAFAGGVDIVQLRMKHASAEAIVAAGRRFAAAATEHGALFILNDRPDLVDATGADGVHVGQDDAAVHAARALVGPERIVGLSTHTPEQIDAALIAPVDYIGVGPVHETPTKPGRPAVGLDLVRYAAAHATVPFFAIGGISPANVVAVHDAGAERIAVVRALTEAPEPDAAARTLRAALTDGARVGAAQ
jgi:thiamine-phosphate pyrophosphorylase